MIFHRALRREMASSAGATFTVLFTISVTWTLMRILGEAAGGKVSSADIIALIGFAVLNYLPTIVILTSFISVLMAVTRSYRDSEMVVWFASGLSLVRWVRPVLVFALPLVLVTGALSLVATPWARMKSMEFAERFEKREDLKKVSPGQFKESGSSNRVFFVESAPDKSNAVQNVFINSVDPTGTTVVVAKEGVIEGDGKGGQFLVLKNGRRYQGKPGQADFQSMEFERYSMRFASRVPVLGADTAVQGLSTPALFLNPTKEAMAEFLWRIAAPIMCALLMLLAIPLGFVNPRAGSSANLILALLIFFTYINLVKVTEGSVKVGRIDFAMGWWPLHLAVALLIMGLFASRLNVNHRYHPLVLLSSLKHGRIRKGAPT
ncbi:MAG: LPS export ABC transporter permease LptF [Massilia sp.]